MHPCPLHGPHLPATIRFAVTWYHRDQIHISVFLFFFFFFEKSYWKKKKKLDLCWKHKNKILSIDGKSIRVSNQDEHNQHLHLVMKRMEEWTLNSFTDIGTHCCGYKILDFSFYFFLCYSRSDNWFSTIRRFSSPYAQYMLTTSSNNFFFFPR